MLTLKEAAAELEVRPGIVVAFATVPTLEMRAKDDDNDCGVLLYFQPDQVARLKDSIRAVCGSRPFAVEDFWPVIEESRRREVADKLAVARAAFAADKLAAAPEA